MVSTALDTGGYALNAVALCRRATSSRVHSTISGRSVPYSRAATIAADGVLHLVIILEVRGLRVLRSIKNGLGRQAG